MDYLLDTHVFLWADAEPAKLSAKVRGILTDRSNRFFLSAASVWEMQIKHQMGKLPLRLSLEKIISEHVARQSIQTVPVELRHIYDLALLPDLHKDPFDRLIVSTARCGKFTVISADHLVQQYPSVTVVW